MKTIANCRHCCIGLIVAISGIVIVLQPSEAHLEKSIIINAPASAIFPEVSRYKNFNAWSPWSKMDPGVNQTYEGEDGTIGSRDELGRSKSGTGSQWIVEIEENKRVKERDVLRRR